MDKNEAAFLRTLRRCTSDDQRAFLTNVGEVLRALDVGQSDQRITFSCQAGKVLALTIGQRYSLSLSSDDSGRVGFIVPKKGRERDVDYGPFGGVGDSWFGNTDNPLRLRENWANILEACKTELSRTKASGFRKFSNAFFERAVFDEAYRESILGNEASAGELGLIMVNITWNSHDWKGPSTDASNHKWVQAGNVPHESWNFDLDNLRNTPEKVYGYSQRTVEPKLEGGNNLVIFHSAGKIVGFYGRATVLREKVFVTEGQDYNLIGTRTLSLVLPNKLEDIKSKGYLEDKQRMGQTGFIYLKDRTTALRMIDEALILNPSEKEKLTGLRDWLLAASGASDVEPNYWIFQGNPAYYDTAGALKAGALESWGIAAHKDKVAPGDKVILWVTGPRAGCYALATVTTPVTRRPPTKADEQFSTRSKKEALPDRVGIRIDHDLSDPPLLKDQILSSPAMSGFKAGNQGTTFSATGEQYRYLLKLAKAMRTPDHHPLNTILYGPPGTGKTYALKARYFGSFTTHISALTREQRLTELLQDLAWWEVAAMVLLDIGPSKTSAIIEHELLRIKAGLSKSANVRATVWGTLQGHTVSECELVKYANRLEPLIFNKREDSIWEVLPNSDTDVVAELRTLLDQSKRNNDQGARQVKRYEFVTFHQSFSYEDFIEGIKPNLSGSEVAYEIVSGVFKQLCSKAEQDPENSYAIFIDEINRGNVSAIFGELITLIEADKRAGMPNALTVVLPYSKMPFSVPRNLHIIGTMNTADRSVEALDSALRRRFSFEECPSRPEDLNNRDVNGVNLTKLLHVINARIEMLLDRDHHIGHSYFMNWASTDPETQLRQVFKNNIIPLLQEYFYGDPVKVGLVLGPAFVQELSGKENQVSLAKGFKAGEDIEPRPRYAFADPTDATRVPLQAFLDICDGK